MRKNKKTKIKEFTAYDNAVVSWYAPEFIQHRRGVVWKITAALFVFAAMTLGFIYLSWTFSLAVAAFSLTYYFLQKGEPRRLQVVISDIGVKVGEKIYPYSQIQGFWIIYKPPYASELNLKITGEFMAYITIQLEDVDPSFVKAYLSQKTPEIKEKDHTFTDILTRLLKI